MLIRVISASVQRMLKAILTERTYAYKVGTETAYSNLHVDVARAVRNLVDTIQVRVYIFQSYFEACRKLD